MGIDELIIRLFDQAPRVELVRYGNWLNISEANAERIIPVSVDHQVYTKVQDVAPHGCS